jgi:membrane-associated protease RseP (regulator of RpoE activity)
LVEGSQTPIPPLFTGWPLFGGEIVGPLSLLLLPAVLGFSEQAISSTPQQKSRFAAKWLTIYSLVLLAITFAAVYVAEFLLLFAIVFSFLGHEALIWYSRWRERKRTPIYVHPKEGLKILAVIPYTPAQKMGLQVGEVIVKVNGQAVHRRKELYKALKHNLAFCKLEVINLEGHLKFPKSSLYEIDHHQLGVILAPDEEVPYYLEQEQANLWHLLRQRITKKSNSFVDQSDQNSLGG